MIKCNLSTMMGEKRLKVSDVARDTGVHRNVITKYYRDEPALLSRDVISKLCAYFDCEVGELLEFTPKNETVAN